MMIMSSLRQRRGGGGDKDAAAAAAAAATTTLTENPQHQQQKKKPRILIVGGGPAGAATAKALADNNRQQCYDVQLVEAYPHPDQLAKTKVYSPKAYVIALGQRGQRALESVGIVPSQIPNSVMSTTLARHARGRCRLQTTPHPSLVAPRQVLTSHLLQQAQQAGARCYMEQSLEVLNLSKRVAHVRSSSSSSSGGASGGGITEQLEYDLLIACDGSNSTVRSLLLQQQQNALEFNVRTEQDSMEYQVAVVDNAVAEGGCLGQESAKFPSTTVHVWNDSNYNSICLAFPIVENENNNNNNKTTTMPTKLLFAIVFPQGKLLQFQKEHAAQSKDQQQSSASGDGGYNDALQSLLPDVPDTTRQCIIQQLAVGQPANGGQCVWTSPQLGSPAHGLVLVGDSGHGMWPSLGQGANCALESVAVFTECIDRVSLDDYDSVEAWSEAVVCEFDKCRHKDVLAAVDLTYSGIGGRTSRGRGNAPLSFKLQVVTMMVLHKLTCGLVPKPALLRIMQGDCVPYSTAYRWNFYYEKIICAMTWLSTMVATGVFVWYRQNNEAAE